MQPGGRVRVSMSKTSNLASPFRSPDYKAGYTDGFRDGVRTVLEWRASHVRKLQQEIDAMRDPTWAYLGSKRKKVSAETRRAVLDALLSTVDRQRGVSTAGYDVVAKLAHRSQRITRMVICHEIDHTGLLVRAWRSHTCNGQRRQLTNQIRFVWDPAMRVPRMSDEWRREHLERLG